MQTMSFAPAIAGIGGGIAANSAQSLATGSVGSVMAANVGPALSL